MTTEAELARYHAESAEALLSCVASTSANDELLRSTMHMQLAQVHATLANIESQRAASDAQRRVADIAETLQVSSLVKTGWTPPTSDAAALRVDALVDLLEDAWGIIANSGVFGNPSEPTKGCREAAERWRDRWHETLDVYCKLTREPETENKTETERGTTE